MGPNVRTMLLGAALLLGGAPAAHAATCSSVGPALTIAPGADVALAVTVDAAGTIAANGTGCPLTAATADTLTIAANQRSVTISTASTSGLGPGATPEPGEASELETLVTSPGPEVTYTDSSGSATTARVGELGGQWTVNLTEHVLGDTDVDLRVEIDDPFDTVTLDLGPGDDTATAAGGNGTGSTPTSPGLAVLRGQAGSDSLRGPGVLDGGPDADTLTAAPSATAIAAVGASTPLRLKADLTGTQPGMDGHGGTDTYVGFGTAAFDVSGTAFDDVLHGNDRRNTLSGGPGADTVVPGGDQDAVFGDQGADVIHAQDGVRDLVSCGAETDSGELDGADDPTGCEFQAPVTTLTGATTPVAEGDPVTLTVTLDQPLLIASTVRLTPGAGTATSADRGPAVTVQVPAGQTVATGVISTVQDTLDEPDETFTVTLGVLTGPALGSPSTTGVTITDDDDTQTAIGLTPDTPDGLSGFHRSAPTVTVASSQVDAGDEIRCVLDPPAAPAGFDDLPATPCPYLGAGAAVTGDGTHTVHAATRKGFGPTGGVASRAFRVDGTPPTLTCDAAPSFAAGAQGASVSAAVADTGSGPSSPTTQVGVATTTPGPGSAGVTGTDLAGNAAGATCPFTVEPPPPPVLPPPPPPLPLCNGLQVTLLDVTPKGRRVSISGLALTKYQGQRVRIVSGGRTVATTKVGPRGTFSVSLRKPTRGTTRYQAVLPSARSRALQLDRFLQITRRAGTRVTGRLLLPRKKRPRTIAIRRQVSCSRQEAFRTVKLRRDGSFTVTLRGPETGGFAVYRVTAKLPRGGTTYTLPIVIRG